MTPCVARLQVAGLLALAIVVGGEGPTEKDWFVEEVLSVVKEGEAMDVIGQGSDSIWLSFAHQVVN